MRLSDERITFIANKIGDALLKKKYIGYQKSKHTLTTQIARTIIKDLQIEDQIDEEVKEIIKSMQREIPEGSSEWVSIFQQQKEILAKRINYIY